MAKELLYLSSYKNVEKLFQKIDAAKKPEALTTRALADIFGLKSTSDRQLITMLKALGFLDQSASPTAQYDLLKNPAQSKQAIAAGIRKAYQPLFEANEKANELSGDALRGLIAQVAGTDKSLASKIAWTFSALTRLGDFSDPAVLQKNQNNDAEDEGEGDAEENVEKDRKLNARRAQSLRPEFHYNIQIHLPANGTEEVYLNIFNAVRKTFR